MDNIYIGVDFSVDQKVPVNEILVAELGARGFESFVETEQGVIGYIQKQDWTSNLLDDIFILESKEFSIQYKVEEILQVNWNSEWEKNFNPITVDETVHVRAPFHESLGLEYDIVIEPKMSFGTGHHETTHLMIQYLLSLDVVGKTVLDMGCGTGILAILAKMKSAKQVDAIDIDQWCYENSLENIERNNCNDVSVFKGDVSLLVDPDKYDLVIANINRNILLSDIEQYSKSLKVGGTLLLSGFYKEDVQPISTESEKYNLSLQEQRSRNKWVALRFNREK